MKATLTSKGQITIPLAIRRRLGLKPGDVLEFDDTAPVLTAHRVIEPEAWAMRVEESRKDWSLPDGLDGNSTSVIEATRGPVELPPGR